MSPFEALYGIKPPQLALGPYLHTNVAAVEEYVAERQAMDRKIKDNLQQARARMKIYADKKRSEREFAEGDWVYLKLQPYRQNSVAGRNNEKLAAKYYGPYQVIERIGKVAYKLSLPQSSKIHPVFHVSLLKKKIGQSQVPVRELPVLDSRGVLKTQPVAVLDRRIEKKNNAAAVQYLVHWAGQTEEEATWEFAETIEAQFPTFEP